jgi:hypothetical protein
MTSKGRIGLLAPSFVGFGLVLAFGSPGQIAASGIVVVGLTIWMVVRHG